MFRTARPSQSICDLQLPLDASVEAGKGGVIEQIAVQKTNSSGTQAYQVASIVITQWAIQWEEQIALPNTDAFSTF